MLATALAAFALLAAAQCLLVVQLADKLTPGSAEDRSNAHRPVDGHAQYA